MEELRLAPESVQEIDLGRVLRGRVAEDVQAVLLEATAPVTATLRTQVSDDLALAAAGPRVDSEAGVALPAGAKRIVVTGATAPGVVVLQAWDADGEEVVSERRVEIEPATATRIRLPDDAVMALVRLGRTSAVVSVEVVDRGLSVLPLHQLVTTGLLPDVRPGAALVPAQSTYLSSTWSGVEAEQLGHLLDDDGVHQCLQLVAALGAVLDRTAEEHQSGGLLALAPHQRGERHGVVAPVVGHHRGVLDGVLDEAQVSLPALVEGCHDIEHELVEALATRAQDGCPRIGRDHRGAAHPPTTAVARTPRRGRRGGVVAEGGHAASLSGVSTSAG